MECWPCKCSIFEWWCICQWTHCGQVVPYDSYLLRRIYTTSEISVRASESKLRRNQNKWINVSCLHWSESESETFVSDVRVWTRPYMQWFPRIWTSEYVHGETCMLKATCSRGCYKICSKMAVALDDLGCSVNTILSGSRTRTRTRMLRQCRCKCALMLHET